MCFLLYSSLQRCQHSTLPIVSTQKLTEETSKCMKHVNELMKWLFKYQLPESRADHGCNGGLNAQLVLWGQWRSESIHFGPILCCISFSWNQRQSRCQRRESAFRAWNQGVEVLRDRCKSLWRDSKPHHFKSPQNWGLIIKVSLLLHTS